MPKTRLKKLTAHDKATIRGFAERVSQQAQIEADRIDPDRDAIHNELGDSDEAHLVRKLDNLAKLAREIGWYVK